MLYRVREQVKFIVAHKKDKALPLLNSLTNILASGIPLCVEKIK